MAGLATGFAQGFQMLNNYYAQRDAAQFRKEQVAQRQVNFEQMFARQENWHQEQQKVRDLQMEATQQNLDTSRKELLFKTQDRLRQQQLRDTESAYQSMESGRIPSDFLKTFNGAYADQLEAGTQIVGAHISPDGQHFIPEVGKKGSDGTIQTGPMETANGTVPVFSSQSVLNDLKARIVRLGGTIPIIKPVALTKDETLVNPQTGKVIAKGSALTTPGMNTLAVQMDTTTRNNINAGYKVLQGIFGHVDPLTGQFSLNNPKLEGIFGNAAQIMGEKILYEGEPFTRASNEAKREATAGVLPASMWKIVRGTNGQLLVNDGAETRTLTRRDRRMILAVRSQGEIGSSPASLPASLATPEGSPIPIAADRLPAGLTLPDLARVPDNMIAQVGNWKIMRKNGVLYNLGPITAAPMASTPGTSGGIPQAAAAPAPPGGAAVTPSPSPVEPPMPAPENFPTQGTAPGASVGPPPAEQGLYNAGVQVHEGIAAERAQGYPGVAGLGGAVIPAATAAAHAVVAGGKAVAPFFEGLFGAGAHSMSQGAPLPVSPIPTQAEKKAQRNAGPAHPPFSPSQRGLEAIGNAPGKSPSTLIQRAPKAQILAAQKSLAMKGVTGSIAKKAALIVAQSYTAGSMNTTPEKILREALAAPISFPLARAIVGELADRATEGGS